jgi:hypothetical protein
MKRKFEDNVPTPPFVDDETEEIVTTEQLLDETADQDELVEEEAEDPTAELRESYANLLAEVEAAKELWDVVLAEVDDARKLVEDRETDAAARRNALYAATIQAREAFRNAALQGVIDLPRVPDYLGI